jgi:hypothetical protein
MCRLSRNSGSLNPQPGALRACPGLYRDCFTLLPQTRLCPSLINVHIYWSMLTVGLMGLMRQGLMRQQVIYIFCHLCCSCFVLSLILCKCVVYCTLLLFVCDCATSRKVADSIPSGVNEIFHWHNPSDRITALGSTQPLTEMRTRYISCGLKADGAYGRQPYNLRVPTVLKSGSLSLLEPSRSVQTCTGTALRFTLA